MRNDGVSNPNKPVEVASFEKLADEFHRRVSRIVYCTVATVAPDGSPRTRILHPLWEGSTGWIATTRSGLKARHLAREPRVSLTYWDPAHDVVSVKALAGWVDDPEVNERVWNLFRATPPPYGYDPAEFWPSGPRNAPFGVLRLEPTRVEITGLASSPAPKMVWRRGQ